MCSHKLLLHTDPYCAVSYMQPNPRQMQSKPIATHAVMPSQTLIPHAPRPRHQLQTHWHQQHALELHFNTLGKYWSPSHPHLLPGIRLCTCSHSTQSAPIFTYNHFASFQTQPPPACSVWTRHSYSLTRAPYLLTESTLPQHIYMQKRKTKPIAAYSTAATCMCEHISPLWRPSHELTYEYCLLFQEQQVHAT